MTNSQGIFGSQNSAKSGSSPFSNPFSSASKDAPTPSPFATVEEASPFSSAAPEPGKPARLPEKRQPEEQSATSPFGLAEPSAGFGFGSEASSFAVRGFEAGGFDKVSPAPASADAASAPSPWSAPAPVAPSEPVLRPVEENPWNRSAAPQQQEQQSQPQAPAQPQQAPAHTISSDTDSSSSIRQLELRAIFGVDRELSAQEILQRVRSLPGLHNVARIGGQEVAALESLRQGLSNLGFGTPGSIHLMVGNQPLHFIREGNVALAVQNDGSFAPGVRETLMIVARELSRMS